MLQTLMDLATRYGYIVVFLGVGAESMGVPVPGETTLLVGAVLAGHGNLSPWLVGGVGWLGAVVGDNIGYAVGRRWGGRLLRLRFVQRVYRPEHLQRAERFFDKHGWAAVFFGRFVAILRIFAGPLAGLHHMPWTHFVAANAAGAAVWVTTIVIIGLLIGSNLDAAANLVARMGYVGLGLTVVAVISIMATRALLRRRRADFDP
ncbi:MAG: DedA family protein [Candidatus Dormibacteria bacterium]